MAITVRSIYYYPIKGLGGTATDSVNINANGLPYDRRFGLEFNDSTALLNNTEKWRPWNYFISLKKSTLAATVRASAAADGDAVQLTLHSGGDSISGNPADARDCRQLEDFLSDTLQLPRLKLIDSGDKRLWDEESVALSLVNTATVAAFAAACDMPIQAARFRANVLFDGLPAWHEEDWDGQWRIGTLPLRIDGGIPRCAATRVNPDNATRDANVPELLYKQRGHNNLGVFAAIGSDGILSTGMEIHPEQIT